MAVAHAGSTGAGRRPAQIRGDPQLTEAGDRTASFEDVAAAAELDEAKRRRVEELVEKEEGATNALGGWLGRAILWFAAGVSILHLYAAAAGAPPFYGTPIIPTYTLRPLHVGLVLALIYVLYPVWRTLRNRVTTLDWLCAVVALARSEEHTSELQSLRHLVCRL